jgi:hypothetical protein
MIILHRSLAEFIYGTSPFSGGGLINYSWISGGQSALTASINPVFFNGFTESMVFMTVGITVVVEWGQQFSDVQVTKVLDFSKPDEIIQIYRDTISKGRGYVINNWVKPNQGNY